MRNPDSRLMHTKAIATIRLKQAIISLEARFGQKDFDILTRY